MKKSLLFYFSGLFSLVPIVSIAQPSIDSIAVTQVNNQSVLTISGSGFGHGPNVAIFDTFTGGTEGEVIPRNAADIGNWSHYSNFAGLPKYLTGLNGNMGHGIRDFDYPTSSLNRMGQLSKRFDQDYTEVYINFDVLVPEGYYFAGASSDNTFPSQSTWKFAWLSDNNEIENSNGYDMCIPQHSGSGSFTISGNEGVTTYLSNGHDWWDHHGYNHISYWQKVDHSDPDPALPGRVGDFSFYAVSNRGKAKKSRQQQQIMFGTSAVFNYISFPGWFGSGNQSTFNAIYDNIYVAVGDNAQARIEIGNATSYEQSQRLDIFAPTSWSDSQIVVPLTGLHSMDQYHVYITDANGERNAIGTSVNLRANTSIQLIPESGLLLLP